MKKYMNKQINKYDDLSKINYCSTCVFFIHVPCFLMRIIYFSFIRLHAYAFSIHSMVHCGSAFEPGTSGLPYYCTSICVRSWCNWRASCVDSKKEKIGRNQDNPTPFLSPCPPLHLPPCWVCVSDKTLTLLVLPPDWWLLLFLVTVI